eukprot:TRINITY_DN318_c1_g1_i1.p1 TRINITY_DN318_c1_g1~~TRINITY_DN318_c1_g1_i1.p1  ORF type:complete len:114 (-),score=36.57 TRINITY_DN318_c1_g1_i1:84-380(-)
MKSVEGWVIMATNIHAESTEEDITDLFSDAGEVKNLHLNIDRKSGFVKGYALIEYATKAEAMEAIQTVDGKDLLGQEVAVSWAFTMGPSDPVSTSTSS